MNFRRAYFNIFLALCVANFVGIVAVIAGYIAIDFHIIGQHDSAGMAAISFLSAVVTTLLLLPIIWWYAENYS